MQKVVYVRTGNDWEGVYDVVTGKLVTEGHSVEYDEILMVLGIPEDTVHEIWIDGTPAEEKLSENGSLPETLSELFLWGTEK